MFQAWYGLMDLLQSLTKGLKFDANIGPGKIAEQKKMEKKSISVESLVKYIL